MSFQEAPVAVSNGTEHLIQGLQGSQTKRNPAMLHLDAYLGRQRRYFPIRVWSHLMGGVTRLLAVIPGQLRCA